MSSRLERVIAEGHVITRATNGFGLGGSITPICSCGWKGREEYNYNDWQYTNLNEQENTHKRSQYEIS